MKTTTRKLFAAILPLLTILSLAASLSLAQNATDESQPIDPALDQWLIKLENKANQIKTLTSDLRYDRINELLDSKEIRRGKFFYQAGPPRNFAAHFDFQLSNRRGEKINKWWIYDGQWLAEKNYKEKFFKRYEVAPPKDTNEKQTEVLELGEGPFAIPIDFEKDSLLKKFEVQLIENTLGSDEDTIHLRLTPRNPEMIEESYFDLWYDRETLLPTMVETVNETQETRSIFKLTNTQLNTDLETNLFDTTPPNDSSWTIDEQRQ